MDKRLMSVILNHGGYIHMCRICWTDPIRRVKTILRFEDFYQKLQEEIKYIYKDYKIQPILRTYRLQLEQLESKFGYL